MLYLPSASSTLTFNPQSPAGFSALMTVLPNTSSSVNSRVHTIHHRVRVPFELNKMPCGDIVCGAPADQSFPNLSSSPVNTQPEPRSHHPGTLSRDRIMSLQLSSRVGIKIECGVWVCPQNRSRAIRANRILECSTDDRRLPVSGN